MFKDNTEKIDAIILIRKGLRGKEILRELKNGKANLNDVLVMKYRLLNKEGLSVSINVSELSIEKLIELKNMISGA